MRGASNFTNDMDFSFSLERDIDSMITTLSCRKMKDGDNFTEIHLEAVPVELGLMRQDGKPATSLIIKESDIAPLKKSAKKITLNEEKVLLSLRKAIERDGVSPPNSIIDLFQDSPENIPLKVVNMDLWRELAYEAITVDSEPEKMQHAKKISFSRCYRSLEKGYLVGLHGSYAWLI